MKEEAAFLFWAISGRFNGTIGQDDLQERSGGGVDLTPSNKPQRFAGSVSNQLHQVLRTISRPSISCPHPPWNGFLLCFLLLVHCNNNTGNDK